MRSLSPAMNLILITHIYLDLLLLLHFQYQLAKSMAGEQAEVVVGSHPATKIIQSGQKLGLQLIELIL